MQVCVPEIIAYEHKNSETGHSVMIIDEVAGCSIEDDMPTQENLKEILRDAGRQLARIHTIPVEGFGWIDKKSFDKLKGEKQKKANFLNK